MTFFNQSGQSKSAATLSTTGPTGLPTSAGKTEADEAFPVAALLQRPHRAVVQQFYCLVRAADDLADAPDIAAEEKAAGLQRLRDQARVTLPALVYPYAAALMDAFTQDIQSPTCATWADTLTSAHRSSVPVGRMLLTLHDGENSPASAASDHLCTALQLLNHIADAHDDQHRLGRCYIPADWLRDAGQDPTPALHRMLAEAVTLLVAARPVVRRINSPRLAFQAALTLACGHRLAALLKARTDWRISPRFGRRAFARAFCHGITIFLLERWTS